MHPVDRQCWVWVCFVVGGRSSSIIRVQLFEGDQASTVARGQDLLTVQQGVCVCVRGCVCVLYVQVCLRVCVCVCLRIWVARGRNSSVCSCLWVLRLGGEGQRGPACAHARELCVWGERVSTCVHAYGLCIWGVRAKGTCVCSCLWILRLGGERQRGPACAHAYGFCVWGGEEKGYLRVFMPMGCASGG